jgi:hypothetical protein
MARTDNREGRVMRLSDIPKPENASDAIVEKITPLFAGVDPVVRFLVIADLFALFISGHRGDDPREVAALRQTLIASHLALVDSLVDMYDDAIAKHGSPH